MSNFLKLFKNHSCLSTHFHLLMLTQVFLGLIFYLYSISLLSSHPPLNKLYFQAIIHLPVFPTKQLSTKLRRNVIEDDSHYIFLGHKVSKKI